MPCYSVNTVSLDFQAGDLALLQKAAAVLGLEVRVRSGTEGGRREIVDRAGKTGPPACRRRPRNEVHP